MYTENPNVDKAAYQC